MMAPPAVPRWQPRRLRCGRSRLLLAPDATVTSWTGHDSRVPALVTAASPGSGLGFVGVLPRRAPSQGVARTQVQAACGLVEVWDLLVECAEPVGRAAPGVALARRVRCLDGPLDVTHSVRLASAQTHGPVAWRPLNRVVFGYFAGRKVTIDGGDVAIQGTDVMSRLAADAGRWTVVTVAFDGHMPIGAAATAWTT